MHYLNSTDADLQLMASINFYAADPSTIQNEANLLFIGTPDIGPNGPNSPGIPPNSTYSVEQYFTPSRTNVDLSGVTFFAITGHEHQYGTNVTVGTGASKGGPFKSVYAPDPFVWSEPVTQVGNFQLPVDGGFDFKCEWNNTSTASVPFGETAKKNEMCFFWAYYYPSKGAFVCVHSDDYGGVDLCCPNPGNALCDQITH